MEQIKEDIHYITNLYDNKYHPILEKQKKNLFNLWLEQSSDSLYNKIYHSKQDLETDVNFIKSLKFDKGSETKYIDILYNKWLDEAEDTFNYEVDNIHDNGLNINNKWCGTHTIFHDIPTKCDYDAAKTLVSLQKVNNTHSYNLRNRV